MRRIHRVTALFVGLLLANLIWVGSGYGCAMPVMEQPSAATAGNPDAMTAVMDGMNMSPTQAPAADNAHQQHEPPCRLPWAPDGCQSMTPCAPLAIASHAFVLDVPNGMPVRVAELAMLTPPSELRAPDLPPPRA